MTETTNLTNHFLIAMPQLEDPNFYHTATYICEHNEEGAMGLIINRPLELTLGEVLAHIDIPVESEEIARIPVYYGGPVQEDRGFVLHHMTRRWESTLKITDELAVTTSRDILANIASGNGPDQFLVTLGYAGWGAGQLERELAENAWLSGPANPEILFNTPVAERWTAAAQSIGVDLNLLSGDTGHA